MKYLAAFISCFIVLSSFSQNEDIHITASVKELYTSKKITKGRVKILLDNKKFKEINLNEEGIAHMTLALDHGYHLYFMSKGYETKWIMIDTRGIPPEDQEGGFKLDLDMTLYPKRKNFDNSCLIPPIGKSKYIYESNSIEFDIDYTYGIKAQIEEQNQIADSLNQPRFEKHFDKGKKLTKAHKFKAAKKQFEKAFKLIPSNAEVRRKLKIDQPKNSGVTS